MTNKGKKLEPPLRLDMSFCESLERFVTAKPEEVEESIARFKRKCRRRMNPSGGEDALKGDEVAGLRY